MGDDNGEGLVGIRLARIEARLDSLESRLRAVESPRRPASAGDVESRRRPRMQPARSAPPVHPPQQGFGVAAQTETSGVRPVPAPEMPPPAPRADRVYVDPTPAWVRRITERSWSAGDLENLLSGRVLAWVGGAAVLLGAIFFLGLAFTRGWIGPAGRVSIGLVAGAAMLAGGAWFFERREALFGHVLVAVGLGTLSTSLVAATRLYGLVPVGVGLAAALVITAVTTAVAIRADSQVVASYGLITGLAAPPLLGGVANSTTIAFLVTTLAGTTAVALYRSWRWLPPVAFVLAAPQLLEWLLGAPAPLGGGLAALAGFWTLNALAAGGEEFRVRRNRLSPTSATLLMANAAYLVGAGFALFVTLGVEGGRGLFLLVTALAHFALAGYFLIRRGEHHAFGMLAAGTGVAALAMAVPVQFGGPVVPVAWAAQATALAWVYSVRRHGYSGVMAVILGTLAVGHLLRFEYPFSELATDFRGGAPFFDSAGATLGFILLALLVSGSFVRSREIRAMLATVGLLLVVYALPFEFTGAALVAAWSWLFVIIVALDRWFAPLAAGRPPRVKGGTALLVDLHIPAAVAACLAIMHTLVFELPPWELGQLPARPFLDERTLTALVLMGAGLLAGAVRWTPRAGRWSVLGAFTVAAYLMPFEVGAAATVVAWSALALGLGALGRHDGRGKPAYLTAAGSLLGLGLLVLLEVVAPPDRLWVEPYRVLDDPPFWSGATAVTGALALALFAGWVAYRSHRASRWLGALGGALVVYGLSVGVVDQFQSLVGGGIGLEALQKQAQVALSILWAALGGVAFVTGVVRWLPTLRVGGLVLLCVATTKVFFYDLASLDATYRVPSFIGLGVLLLLSSYTYQRLRPTRMTG